MLLITTSIALAIVNLFIIPAYSSGNLCLLKPYITSAILNTQLVSPNKHKLTLDVDLDYTKEFRIDNLILYSDFNSNQHFLHHNEVTVEFISNIATPRMARDIIGTKTYQETKQEYYLRVPRLFKTYKKPDPRFMAELCSPVSLKDAYIFDSTKNQFSTYKEEVRCHAYADSQFNIEYKDCCISAASFRDGISVEFYPDFMKVEVQKLNQQVNGTAGTRAIISWQLEYIKLFGGLCFNLIESLQLLETTDEDYLSAAPFSTFAKYNDTFLGFKPQIDSKLIDGLHKPKYQELFRWNKTPDGYKMSIGKTNSLPWVYEPNTSMLKALSISNDPVPTGHAFYHSHNYRCKYHYLRNFQPDLGTPNRPEEICTASVPDDITHWSSCRKIVAIYGFVYGLFEYDGDLLRDQVHYQLFDEKLFDYPISAVHAEGNEFWFFIKPYTVQVMKASSKDCSKLELVKKHTIHYRQLFDPEIKQVALEGRYYDGEQWIPSWDYVPPMTFESPEVWTYVGAGLALTAIFLILLFIYILRRSERHRGASVFSLSRNSSLIHKSIPLTSQKNNTPVATVASALPLFSQHESLRHSSSSSVGKKGKSPKRRKYLENPINKQKKSKSPLKQASHPSKS